MNIRLYLKTSGLSSERQYFVKKGLHNFRSFESYLFFLLILSILRKGRGSGKYFSLKKGPAGEQV
jgi:hypothetical protein